MIIGSLEVIEELIFTLFLHYFSIPFYKTIIVSILQMWILKLREGRNEPDDTALGNDRFRIRNHAFGLITGCTLSYASSCYLMISRTNENSSLSKYYVKA